MQTTSLDYSGSLRCEHSLAVACLLDEVKQPSLSRLSETTRAADCTCVNTWKYNWFRYVISSLPVFSQPWLMLRDTLMCHHIWRLSTIASNFLFYFAGCVSTHMPHIIIGRSLASCMSDLWLVKIQNKCRCTSSHSKLIEHWVQLSKEVV